MQSTGIHRLKVQLVGYNSVDDNTGLSSFVWSCYCLRNTRNVAKFQENFTLQQFKVIDLGVNAKPIYDLLLVINCNFSRICYHLEIFTLKDRKLLILPTPPLFDAPTREEPLRISGWNLSRKN